jgi:epoxyqueuosine reductase
MTTPPELTARLEAKARALGLSLFGVASAEPSAHMPYYADWVARERHGGMGYLAREDSVARRADLRGTMDAVASVVVVGHEYYQEDDPARAGDPARGVVARYARGEDYHHVLKDKLLTLQAWLEDEVRSGPAGGSVQARAGSGPASGTRVVREEHYSDRSPAWLLVPSRTPAGRS